MRTLLCLILLLGAIPLTAQTPWEPNNTAGTAKDIYCQIASTWSFAGIAPPLTGNPNDPERIDLAITGTDVDWFRVGTLITVPTGTMIVALRQVTEGGNYPLQLQITDSTGATVLSSPTVGTYQQFTAPPVGVDIYDGARAQANTTAGTSYLIRVSSPVTVPTGVTATYQLAVEFTPIDSGEGTYTNNFPGVAPGFAGHPADATPVGVGPGNAKAYVSAGWRGMDYYMVRLTSPASITVDLANFANQPSASTNLDLYWVTSQGVLQAASAAGQPLAGASDTYPTGYTGVPTTAVTTPNTSEQIITPALAPGTYYFQVWAWNISGLPGIGLSYNAGNYDITFTLTAMSDDALEGATQNDTAANATTIPTGSTANLRLLYNGEGLEEDWYKVNVPDGGNLNVRLTLTTPATDDLNIQLYRPNAANPGQADDQVDGSAVTNTNVATKGTTTASEIVGTWGSVGNSGNTGFPSGDWLIRVLRGPSFINGGVPLGQIYSLNITISAANVDIAPDDTMEPNDNITQAQTNANLVLQPGLNSGLKSMDFQDWYRIPGVQFNWPVEITLIYDGNATTDLDIVVFDLAFGPGGPAAPQRIGDNFANENAPASLAQVQGIAGSTYATNPGTQPIYVVIQRWNSVGASYSINVNINGNDPLPTLRMNSVSCNPTAVTAPGSTQVTVAVENIGGTAADLTSLNLTLTHSGGVGVTNQYTIGAPTPALPATIPAMTTQNFVFSVQSTAQCTNGQITARATGQDGGGNALLGSPSGTFTLSGGVPPAPMLVFASVQANGLLNPGGSLVVTATIRNDGTAGGDFGNTPPITFTFTQGASDVTAKFGAPAAPSVPLPLSLAPGATNAVSWTFTIAGDTPFGGTQVAIGGGGPDNPATPGTVSFTIASKSSTNPTSGSSGCAPAGPTLPILPVALAAVLAAAGRRRKE